MPKTRAELRRYATKSAQFCPEMNSQIVFLFDVDNTLLDNDHIIADLKRHLGQRVSAERAQHYWAIFERLRPLPAEGIDDPGDHVRSDVRA